MIQLLQEDHSYPHHPSKDSNKANMEQPLQPRAVINNQPKGTNRLQGMDPRLPSKVMDHHKLKDMVHPRVKVTVGHQEPQDMVDHQPLRVAMDQMVVIMKGMVVATTKGHPGDSMMMDITTEVVAIEGTGVAMEAQEIEGEIEATEEDLMMDHQGPLVLAACPRELLLWSMV